jgi:hypothetical protein
MMYVDATAPGSRFFSELSEQPRSGKRFAGADSRKALE